MLITGKLRSWQVNDDTVSLILKSDPQEYVLVKNPDQEFSARKGDPVWIKAQPTKGGLVFSAYRVGTDYLSPKPRLAASAMAVSVLAVLLLMVLITGLSGGYVPVAATLVIGGIFGLSTYRLVTLVRRYRDRMQLANAA